MPIPYSLTPNPYTLSFMLLANADDFGLTPGVNRSIVELHAARALSSATLMATAPFFDDAVRLAQDHPGLEVGCHILLVDGTPALPPAQIPSLVMRNGRFRDTLTHFVRDLFTFRIRPEEIAAEATAQIRRLQAAGLRVSHVDTHKHTHLFSGVLRPVLQAARACAVPAIRNPFEPAWALRATPNAPALRRFTVIALRTERRAFLQRVRAASLATPSGTIGLLATGTTGPDAVRATVHSLLAALPSASAEASQSVWELVCHPGYTDAHLDQVRTRLRASRAHEHAALLASLPAIPLASWRDLPPGGN